MDGPRALIIGRENPLFEESFAYAWAQQGERIYVAKLFQ